MTFRVFANANRRRRCAAILMLYLSVAGCSSPQGTNAIPILNVDRSDRDLRPTTGQRTTGYDVLFTFGSNVYGLAGWVPLANLIAVGGALYGTTAYGGTSGCGTVFRITTDGSESVLHAFNCTTDGAYPAAGLTVVNGALYGTTGGAAVYGQSGLGTLFSISPHGKRFRVRHTFVGVDGAYPLAAIIEKNGTLYGTTYGGGAFGKGTVFCFSPATGAEHVTYSFSGNADGSNPLGALLFLGGRLYGTTQFGGQSGGGGTVFRVTTEGAEKVLHSFGGGSDGLNPRAGLVAIGRSLYGTTEAGGTSNNGTAFKVDTSGNEHVLHSFRGGSDGSDPRAALTLVNGIFYGTTFADGSVGYGTLFQLTPRGHERVLHTFGTVPNDGASPAASLLDFDGELYGTTAYGGVSPPSCPKSGGCYFGSVFALRP